MIDICISSAVDELELLRRKVLARCDVEAVRRKVADVNSDVKEFVGGLLAVCVVVSLAHIPASDTISINLR